MYVRWCPSLTAAIVTQLVTPPLGSARSGSVPNLLIRRFPCGHPDPFRSVRDLGFVAARCSHPSGELQGRSSVWLPAWLPSVAHHHALALVITIGPLPGAVTAPCPAQAPPLASIIG
jgi:hypothetical protein